MGTGGDSHTRFPIGVSFPAGSGLVAFAGALGFMPLDMPESVLVRFSGEFRSGITLRDAVNAIPLWAIKKGLLTVPKKNKKNVFNGRIVEMEGLPDLTVEQGFELTDAAAERSAAAGCIQLSEESVKTFLRSSVALIRAHDRGRLSGRRDPGEAGPGHRGMAGASPVLKADATAEYAAVIEIDLGEITEPILACPNDPDDVKVLSEVAGTAIRRRVSRLVHDQHRSLPRRRQDLGGPQTQPRDAHLHLSADADGSGQTQERGLLRVVQLDRRSH